MTPPPLDARSLDALIAEYEKVEAAQLADEGSCSLDLMGHQYDLNDYLLATRLFDLEWRPWKPYYQPSGWYPRSFHGPCTGDDGGTPEGYEDHLPRYSGSGDGMVRIIEKMAEKYGLHDPKAESVRTFMLCPDMENGIPTKRWYCEFPLPRWEEATADTPEDAVALAALRAVGWKEAK